MVNSTLARLLTISSAAMAPPTTMSQRAPSSSQRLGARFRAWLVTSTWKPLMKANVNTSTMSTPCAVRPW